MIMLQLACMRVTHDNAPTEKWLIKFQHVPRNNYLWHIILPIKQENYTTKLLYYNNYNNNKNYCIIIIIIIIKIIILLL